MTSLVFFAFRQQTVGAALCLATLDLSLLGENHRLLRRWLDRLQRARIFFETTDAQTADFTLTPVAILGRF